MEWISHSRWIWLMLPIFSSSSNLLSVSINSQDCRAPLIPISSCRTTWATSNFKSSVIRLHRCRTSSAWMNLTDAGMSKDRSIISLGSRTESTWWTMEWMLITIELEGQHSTLTTTNNSTISEENCKLWQSSRLVSSLREHEARLNSHDNMTYKMS